MAIIAHDDLHENSEAITLNIDSVEGIITLTVNKRALIMELMEAYCWETDHDIDRLIFRYNGIHISRYNTLEFYNIRNGDFITCDLI